MLEHTLTPALTPIATPIAAAPGNPAYGQLFPTEDGHAMVTTLGIAPDERVLDVGGGAAPLPAATVIVDYDLHGGIDRDHQTAPVDPRWIVADAQALPFRNDSFDFVYCSHVLEHVRDPARACEELMRVAPRGYLETPRKFTELLHGHPTHRWLVDVVDGVLTFERRCFRASPMENMLLPLLVKQSTAYRCFLVDQRNFSCVQLPWKERFSYRIIESEGWQEAFDYDNPLHAAQSHYFYALNLLGYGAPVGFVSQHAAHAMHLSDPQGKHAALNAACALLAGDLPLARSLLTRAQDCGCEDESLDTNLALLDRGCRHEAALPDGKGHVRDDAQILATERQAVEAAIARVTALEQSTSWRVTSPLRGLRRLLDRCIAFFA